MGHAPSGGGPNGILVYCADYRCSHSIEIAADGWPDEIRLSDIEPRFTCTACGKRGADVRPHFEPATIGPPSETALLQALEFEREPSTQHRPVGVANLDR
jgi:hypothetical protein